MTKFLSELITDETPILDLTDSSPVSNEQKHTILDLEGSLSSIYIRHMYYKNNLWYYFKQDDNNYGYPFFIIDELMGSYLAKKRELGAVSYQIAKASVKLLGKTSEEYGIASINFKKEEFKYKVLQKLIDNPVLLNDEDKIKYLESLCISMENREQFLTHLFRLFSLDIYMLQKDRGNVNLQFKINKLTNYFDLAPIYDFSNCSPNIGMAGLKIMNVIYELNELSIIHLGKEYPEFKDELLFWLDQSQKETWVQICKDYQFNQDCGAYERILDYYEIKEESTKKYMKQLLNDIQK